MITTLSRILKYGLQNFQRNGWLSVATIAVMLLVLLTFQGVIIFGATGGKALEEFQDKIDISVYFRPEVSEDQILKVEEALEQVKEVKAVEYVSKDKALEIFKIQHQDESVISSALAELEDNPLLASLNVKAKDPNDYSTIASYLEGESLKSVIEKVTFKENRLVIERLASLVSTGRKVGLFVVLFLSVIAALVVFNTIRIAIYSNREEIGVLRLVGASNGFINGPYVVSGAIYGVIAAAATMIFTVPAVLFAAPYVSVFIPSMDLTQYLTANLFSLLVYQLFFGVGLGVVSSAIAIRRYLKI